MPVDAIMAAATGPDWQIAMPEAPQVSAPDGGIPVDGGMAIDGAPGAVEGAGGSQGFGGMLADQVKSLQGLQDNAAQQSQALATGQATDVSQVVMSVERAQLAMQLAANLRDKGTEAFQESFRTQV